MRVRLVVASLAMLATSLEMPVHLLSAAPARPEAVLSVGSLTDSLVTAAVTTPVAVTALPDGRAIVLEQAGNARVIKNGALLPTPALSLTVCSESERGLLGLAPDPFFGANGFVYVYYTRIAAGAPGGCVNRVSRFTMSGDLIAPSSEVVLLDNIGSPAGNHNGGDVAVGNDGFLYVSVGDGGCDPRGNSGCAGGNDAAQDLSLLNGKILRIDRTTGAPAPGNPFSGAGTAVCGVRGNTPSTPTTTCREIFAYGLRNPWRFAFDPNTGATRFAINDVGQNTREEVDFGILGANYGWPVREGFCAQGANRPCAGAPAGVVQPLTDYAHADTGSYITGGAFVPNGAWARAFDGGYFFADGNPGSIFFRNSAGVVNYTTPFATGVGGISDLAFVMDAPGWSLYYVLPGDNQVRKIAPRYTGVPATGNLAYVPVTPARVFDTSALGANSGPMRAGTSRPVRVASIRGIHRAAVVNIIVVQPQNPTSVTAWYPRALKPDVPVAIVDRLATVSTTAVVPIDPYGLIMLHTTGTARVVVDVIGFFDATVGGKARSGRFAAVSPTRAVSTLQAPNATTNVYTRSGTVADTIVNVPIGTRFGVVRGATAVALVVQAIGTPPGAGGHVLVHPHGTPLPVTPFVNIAGAADRRSNLVIVPIGANGSIDLRLRNVQDVVVDVVGSFTGAGATLASLGTFVPAQAQRVVDTRRPLGLVAFGAAGSAALNPSTVPDNAAAVAQSLWMVAPAAAGSAVAWGARAVSPSGVSVYVSAAGLARANLAFTGLSTGVERIAVSAATNLIVDVFGWFSP